MSSRLPGIYTVKNRATVNSVQSRRSGILRHSAPEQLCSVTQPELRPLPANGECRGFCRVHRIKCTQGPIFLHYSEQLSLSWKACLSASEKSVKLHLESRLLSLTNQLCDLGLVNLWASCPSSVKTKQNKRKGQPIRGSKIQWFHDSSEAKQKNSLRHLSTA